MDTSVGLATLKEFVAVGFGAAALITDAATSSGLNVWLDVKKAMDLLPEAKDAVAHEADAVAALENLSDADRADLYSYAVTQLQMPSGAAQGYVQKSLGTFFQLLKIYQIWKPAPAPAPAPAAA